MKKEEREFVDQIMVSALKSKKEAIGIMNNAKKAFLENEKKPIKDNWGLFKKSISILFFFLKPIIKIYKSYFTPLGQCLQYHKEPLCEYLTVGTTVTPKEMQAVIDRIKRDNGFETKSKGAEETYQVKKQSFIIARYAKKRGCTVAVAYHIVKNNHEILDKETRQWLTI
jgi:hypothetical protein